MGGRKPLLHPAGPLGIRHGDWEAGTRALRCHKRGRCYACDVKITGHQATLTTVEYGAPYCERCLAQPAAVDDARAHRVHGDVADSDRADERHVVELDAGP